MFIIENITKIINDNNDISFKQFNHRNVIIALKEECLRIVVIVRHNLNENISEKLDIR